MSAIGTAELVFLLLLLFVIVFGVLARRLRVPYPIVMVIGGLLLGLLPGIPQITLNPDIIFLVVLPPLLYSSAWTTSWRDFRYNLISILLLAFGLVAFTVCGVALLAPRLLPGFDWRLGLVLGAIVAPTDAIAATAIARRVGLPARIVDVLEGESLINDASGLLALQFGTAAIVENRLPTIAGGILTLVWLVIGGVLIGLVTAWLVDRIERLINDAPIEITLSILTPYATYLAANSVHASGVLAVVACGLFLSRRSAVFFSPQTRIQIWSVWESLTYVLNGLVFVLIGLQLPTVRASIGAYSTSALLIDGALFSLLLILLRLAWTFPGARLAYFIRIRFLHQKVSFPRVRQVFVVGWTGMRGVVSLAAALALPMTLANGTPFPYRELIVFLTFYAIVVTLAVQGITLPPLIRALGLAGTEGPNCEEQEARRIITEAAVAHLEEAKLRDEEASDEIYADLSGHYRQRLAILGAGKEQGETLSSHQRYVELSLETLRIERATVIGLRNGGRINDEVLRRIEHELDLAESRLAG